LNESLDHILWACADLEDGIRRFEDLTGLTPRFGGVHAGGRTHNALIALGPRCYLEILAPTGPESPQDDAFTRLARERREPKVVTFCMRSALRLDDVARRAAALGALDAIVESNGRTTPEGVKLTWRWVSPKLDRFGLAFPFFIDWQDSPHPAEMLELQAPGDAARLERFVVAHPAAADLERTLIELGAPVATEAAAAAHFTVELHTPRGRILL
jgi:hypothetical protein